MELSFKHRSLPEQVADHIVVLMATGELSPGERLFENNLTERLGVSRIPVREALRILQAQGVVHTEPNRGTFISEYGTEETQELLKVRLSVETLAMRRLVAMGRKDPSVFDAVERALDHLKKRNGLGDKLDSCQADLAFHAQIVESCGSPVLLPIWQSLARGVLVYFMHERQAYYDYAASVEEHVELMRLIRAGEVEALEAALEQHIMNPRAALGAQDAAD